MERLAAAGVSPGGEAEPEELVDIPEPAAAAVTAAPQVEPGPAAKSISAPAPAGAPTAQTVATPVALEPAVAAPAVSASNPAAAASAPAPATIVSTPAEVSNTWLASC